MSQNTAPSTVALCDVPNSIDTFESISNVELSFLLPTNQSVNLDPGNLGEKTTDYLARRIARKPDDLLSHIQRINLCIKLKNREGTYSALLDLFIAVEKNGKYLRQRMLDRSKPLLDKKKYNILNKNIDQGVNPLTVMPLATSSVLGMGLTGTPYLLKHM